MTYRKKFIILASVAAGLALVFLLSIIFDPQNISTRSDEYAWIESSQIPLISGITITSPNSEEAVEIARIGGKWVVVNNRKNYPARHLRVEDFLAALSKKAPYPVRSSSASSHEKLSMVEGSTARVTMAGGAGLPILDLLIGQPDITGKNVYLRKQGENEVRSGEDIFSTYTRMTPESWYNLRLFPESEDGKLDVSVIQRVTVYAPSENQEQSETQLPFALTRRNKTWNFNTEITNPDMGKFDSYVRDILNTSGQNFAEEAIPESLFNYARITFEVGNDNNNRLRTIAFARLIENADDEENIQEKFYAKVTGNDLIYVLPSWKMSQLFPNFMNFVQS